MQCPRLGGMPLVTAVSSRLIHTGRWPAKTYSVNHWHHMRKAATCPATRTKRDRPGGSAGSGFGPLSVLIAGAVFRPRMYKNLSWNQNWPHFRGRFRPRKWGPESSRISNANSDLCTRPGLCPEDLPSCEFRRQGRPPRHDREADGPAAAKAIQASGSAWRRSQTG
jgi:hypothetical protein